MEVKYGLASIPVTIHNNPVPSDMNIFPPPHFRRNEEDFPRKRYVFPLKLVESRDVLSRNDKDVHRGLWMDILKCNNI